ncbi:MAG: mannose-1-phosphate guanylyltransferase [Myxococcaceae bacterium]
MNDVFTVIMAGGSGTRFWPLSRSNRPKQFLALTGGQSMIAETMKRMSAASTPARTSVVCGQKHAALVKKALPKLPKANVVVEPEARNTAPAIALACAHVAHSNPQGVVVVVPSDQHVADVPAFQRAVEEAVRVARTGSIVTLGITPTRPDTGYGYIKVGDALDGEAKKVAAFAEKPNLETAQGYLAAGNYLWNAGIFVFRVDVMLAAFSQLMPELYAALGPIRSAWGTKKAQAALKKHFKQMPATSIDYGVAEKASNIAVVPASCGWSDVGSFNALPDVRAKDTQGNVTEGLAFVIDTSGSVVLAQKSRPVAVVGMKDVVVVDAGDAILVLPKDKSQDVRKVVEALKAKKLAKFL